MKRVGQNIRDARMAAGLRQIDVNMKAGLTYRHYQNIEAGKINVTLSTLCRLAKLFKTSVRDLVDGC
jgi:transcriptional regulator with XRE-family HTH domain